MGVWGAVIGGFVGGVFGGPVGAGLGAALGGALDSDSPQLQQLPMRIEWIDDPDGRQLFILPQSVVANVMGYVIHLLSADTDQFIKGHKDYSDDDGDFRVVVFSSEQNEVETVFVPLGAAHVVPGQSLRLRVSTIDEQGNVAGVSLFDVGWPTGTYSPCAKLRPIIGLSMRVARADGKLDRDEVALIRRQLTEAFELEHDGLNHLRQMMKSEPSASVEEQVIRLFQRLPGVSAGAVLNLLADIARADGVVSAAEVEVIKEVAVQMGLSPDQWGELATELGLVLDSDQLEQALAVLGLSPNATLAEAKAAFRSKIREYHPDKFINLPAEFQEVAHRKSQDLNAAWNIVSRLLA